ncbi:MAG: hypothetical protein IJ627_03995, partial [Bacteroidales bacterium]|nr:hypothetical protein [Bacteroidales bacterium]
PYQSLIVTEEWNTLPEDSVPLRSTPAPPIVSCVPARGRELCIQRAPSPYPCAGVHKPPGGYALPPSQ